MTHLQESDLPNIIPEQVSEHVGDIVRLVEKGKRLPPEIADAFANVNLENGRGGWNRINIALLAGTVLGPAATGAVVDTYPENLPDLPTLHPLLNNLLRHLYNPFPLRSEVSESADLLQHIPELTFAGMAALATVRTAPAVKSWLGRRIMADRARAAQSTVSQSIAEGVMPWNIAPGTRIAFVGDGNLLASSLAERQGVGQLQIAYDKPREGYWTHLPREVTEINQVNQRLELANLENGGEVFIYPTEQMHQFLPGPEDYDISNDRIVFYIRQVDRYCRARDETGPRQVVVIGSKSQGMDYATVNAQGRRKKSSNILEKRLEVLRQERGGDIDGRPNTIMIDPTELIMRRIIDLAGGKEITLHGTEESVNKYHTEFFARLKKQNYEITRSGSVRVVYNFNDLPTVTETEYEDIAVLSDPDQEPELQSRGMDPERILVVPDEVIDLVSLSAA